MAEPIVITVKDELGTTSTKAGVSSNNATGQSQTALNGQAKTNKSKSNAAVVSKMIALRSVNYTTSNIGKWTGNKQNQASINAIRTGIGYATAIAINPLIGAVAVGLDAATYAIDYSFERRAEKIQAIEVQNRVGGKGGYRR